MGDSTWDLCRLMQFRYIHRPWKDPAWFLLSPWLRAMLVSVVSAVQYLRVAAWAQPSGFTCWHFHLRACVLGCIQLCASVSPSEECP